MDREETNREDLNIEPGRAGSDEEVRRTASLRGGVAGAAAAIVVGLAVFGAVTLADRGVGFARAQTPDDGMGGVMSPTSGGMQSMMGNGQTMANMDEMVTLCTQHMRDIAAMMPDMTAQPRATPVP